MASQYRDQTQKDWMNAVANRAQYEDKMFEYNQWVPYQWERNRIDQLENRAFGLQMEAMDQGSAANIMGMNMANQNMYYMMNNPYFQNMFAGMGQQQQPMNNVGFNMPWNTGRASYSPNPGTYDQISDINKVLG